MPTVLDQLTLELGWDIKKFLESAKEVEQNVRSRREDFERSSKIWEFALGNLTRLLTGVTAAFLSIEAAMRGLDATRTISKAGTEFALFAESVGMGVQQLSMWEQALERVGGSANDVREAFKSQQSKFTNAFGLEGGPPFDPLAGGYLQRLGINPESYWNKAEGKADLDRFNKDIFDAFNRKHLSPPERQQVLTALGWGGNAAQRLSQEDFRRRLEETRRTAPTRENIEAFRRLNELWAALGQNVTALGRDIVTWIQEPLGHILDAINKIVTAIRDVLPTFKKGGTPGAEHPLTDWLIGKPTPAPSTPGAAPAPVPSPAPASPGITEQPGFRPGTWWPFGDPASSGGTSPSSPRSVVRTPSQAPPGPPATFQDRFAPMEPGAPGISSFEGRWPTPGETLGAPPASGRSFNDYTRRNFKNLSALTDLSSTANTLSVQPSGSVVTNNQNSTTIGGISFHSSANDSKMGTAPSSVEKDLSVGQRAVHYNEAFE